MIPPESRWLASALAVTVAHVGRRGGSAYHRWLVVLVAAQARQQALVDAVLAARGGAVGSDG
jgi:hypothetical protein